MKKSIFVMVAAGLLGSGSAIAAPYGAAGCGLGSMIFDASSGKFMQILAATTNGTSGNQTFGITSGTSNCDGSAASGAASAKTFVATNRSAVSKDIARGQGETINSLASLAGCQSSAAVGSTLQRNFGKIFPSAQVSDAQVGDHVIEVLRQDAALACGNLG